MLLLRYLYKNETVYVPNNHTFEAISSLEEAVRDLSIPEVVRTVKREWREYITLSREVFREAMIWLTTTDDGISDQMLENQFRAIVTQRLEKFPATIEYNVRFLLRKAKEELRKRKTPSAAPSMTK